MWRDWLLNSLRAAGAGVPIDIGLVALLLYCFIIWMKKVKAGFALRGLSSWLPAICSPKRPVSPSPPRF